MCHRGEGRIQSHSMGLMIAYGLASIVSELNGPMLLIYTSEHSFHLMAPWPLPTSAWSNRAYFAGA